MVQVQATCSSLHSLVPLPFFMVIILGIVLWHVPINFKTGSPVGLFCLVFYLWASTVNIFIAHSPHVSWLSSHLPWYQLSSFVLNSRFLYSVVLVYRKSDRLNCFTVLIFSLASEWTFRRFSRVYAYIKQINGVLRASIVFLYVFRFFFC